MAPGSNTTNPLPKPPSSPPHLIWTGFQPTTTGSRVFLQTTGPVEFEVKEGRVGKAGRSSLTVLLRGCRIFMANNRRKLDTRAFATPVQSVSAKQRRKDVEVLITLHEPAKATPGTDPGPNGSQFVVLDFPPGKPTPIEDRPPAGSEPASDRASVGDNWSFSDSGANAPPDAKAKAKSKGKAEPVAAPEPAGAKGEQVPKSVSPPPAPAK
ncbi:MAG TPA: AMIN domain-containing protein [Polyangia bacterium]